MHGKKSQSVGFHDLQIFTEVRKISNLQALLHYVNRYLKETMETL